MGAPYLAALPQMWETDTVCIEICGIPHPPTPTSPNEDRWEIWGTPDRRVIDGPSRYLSKSAGDSLLRVKIRIFKIQVFDDPRTVLGKCRHEGGDALARYFEIVVIEIEVQQVDIPGALKGALT